MLEVFAYRKYKQRKKQKESQEGKTKEALSKQDEEFLRQSLNTKPMPGMKSIFKGLIQRKSAKSGRLTDDEPAATRDGGMHFVVLSWCKEQALQPPRKRTFPVFWNH